MSDLLFNIAEILVSIFALIYAIRAFNQSIKAHEQSIKARKYSSFETIFSQMLSLQRSFFDNRYMLNANGRPLTDEFVSMFVYLKDLIYPKIPSKNNSQKDSTISICENILKIARLDSEIAKLNSDIANRKSKNIELEPLASCLISLKNEKTTLESEIVRQSEQYGDKQDSAQNNISTLESGIGSQSEQYGDKQDSAQNNISTQCLSAFYRDFTSQVLDVEYFKNCFKFIYNIVMLVEKSKIDVEDKQLYIDRIQALLNRNEMFCYFVNLVEHGSKLKDNEKKKHDAYIVLLKDNSFFKDLDDKNGRFNDILSRIDSKLLDQFGIEIENRQK